MRLTLVLALCLFGAALSGPLLPGVAAAESAAATAAPTATGIVNADRLNIRSGPGTTHAVVASVARGTHLTVLETGAEWIRVRTEDGKEGWAAAKYVAIEPPDSGSAPGGRTPEAAETEKKPAPSRTPAAAHGGSALGSVLKWTTLAGGVVLAGLAWNEHTQGNDAYDDYKSAVESGTKTPDDAEPLRLDAIDHDDSATLYAGVAGGLFALFLVQQFLLGGDEEGQTADAGVEPAPPVVVSLRGDGLCAGLVLARF